PTAWPRLIFLSCLCGSEPRLPWRQIWINFLSCLCGSEHHSIKNAEDPQFLSCLCGSELGYKPSNCLIFKEQMTKQTQHPIFWSIT
ncbi:MAG: hypothetical protein RSG22_17135, partial [Comamonas sp.]